MRKIIHVDMDAYFAAVEIRDKPYLKGKPVIIGGDPNSRGVVSTCNYEARKYGVHSAMASSKAKRLCPHGVFLTPHMDLYVSTSKVIQSIFYDYTDLVEPLSLDEAYLDVTEAAKEKGATYIAKSIKEKIVEKTQLTASAGVSYNKFLAKIASDWNKPNGLTIIPPEKAQEFLMQLKIDKFYGVGKKTSEKMKKMGIYYGKDLYEVPLYVLEDRFGSSGNYYYEVVRGIDHRSVCTERERKSYGKETTFQTDISELRDIMKYLERTYEQLKMELLGKELRAEKLTVKIRFADFTTRTKVISQYHDKISKDQLFSYISKYIKDILTEGSLRLTGLTFSSLKGITEPESCQKKQLMLFSEI